MRRGRQSRRPPAWRNRIGSGRTQPIPRRDLFGGRTPSMSARARRGSPLAPAQSPDERLRQPVVIGRLVVALGGDPDQHLLRRAVAGERGPRGRASRRSGPGCRPPARGWRRRASAPASSAMPGTGTAAIDPSIESGAGGGDPERRGDPVPPGDRELVVAGHDRRPATAVRGRRRHPGDRGGQRQVRRRVARCPSSRTRRGSAIGRSAASFAPCDTTSGWIRSRRSARTHRTAEPFGAHSHLWPLPVQ